MKSFGEYLYRDVKITCKDGKTFKGSVDSFGGSVQGKEEYDREEKFICIYTGDASYVLFESEIKEIAEI